MDSSESCQCEDDCEKTSYDLVHDVVRTDAEQECKNPNYYKGVQNLGKGQIFTFLDCKTFRA